MLTSSSIFLNNERTWKGLRIRLDTLAVDLESFIRESVVSSSSTTLFLHFEQSCTIVNEAGSFFTEPV